MARGNALTALAGLTGLGAATLAAVPAVAAPVEGCGAAPDGASLERIGDICELSFSTPGDYDWTVPESLAELYAVVVGAGGGADWRATESFGEGYAGVGGEVRYFAIDDSVAGDSIEVVVGAGGASGTEPTSGSASSLTAEALSVEADGGAPGSFEIHECAISIAIPTYVGNGDGAGGPANDNGFACDETYAPGIVPATDTDSEGNAALTIFADYTTELAAGGRVVLAVDATSAAGQGANVLYTEDSLTADDAGADGLVVFRYLATADGSGGGSDSGGNEHGGGDDDGGNVDAGDGTAVTDDTTPRQLAATGAEAWPIATLAALLTALGLSAALVTRRRDARRAH